MSEPSEMPRSHPNLEFPYGDIDSGECAEKAHAWLEGCENLQGNQDVKIKRIFHEINMATLFWDASPATRKMHKEAINVCDTWDEREHPGKQFARIGFVAAHSLVIRSNIFPATIADFSTELENMKNPKRTNVRHFGAAAWKGTRMSHPALFTINLRLNGMLSDLRGGLSEEDMALQKAGISLSNMLGVHSRLDENVRHQHYIGVKEGIDATQPLSDKPVTDWLQR